MMPRCTDTQPLVLCSLTPEETASTTACALMEAAEARGRTRPNTGRVPCGDLDCGMGTVTLSSSQAFFLTPSYALFRKQASSCVLEWTQLPDHPQAVRDEA